MPRQLIAGSEWRVRVCTGGGTRTFQLSFCRISPSIFIMFSTDGVSWRMSTR